MINKTLLVLVLGITISTVSGYAQDYPTYTGKKLGRGLSNTALGWTEVLRSEERTLDDYGPIGAIFWGPLDGVGNAVKRTALGVYEVATFPIKTSDEAYTLMEPEFPFQTNKAGERPKGFKI